MSKWSDDLLNAGSCEDVSSAAFFAELQDYLKLGSMDDCQTVFRAARFAVSYIKAAVGEFDEEDDEAVALFHAIAQDYYDNRELMQSEQQMKKRQQWMWASVILQLQQKYDLKQEEEANA